MIRLVSGAMALHLAHLADEALGGMHDDPIITRAYAPLAALGPRHAAYLVFQLTFAAALVATALVARGGLGRRVITLLYGVALVGEVHHPLRALLSGATNAGLWTSLPLPVAGAALLFRLADRKDARCSLT